MPKIERKTQKVFAGEANGDLIAVFGSMKTGTPQYSSDIEELQAGTYSQGWSDAILNDKAPYLEEMNGVQYGLSKQIAYLLQQGLANEYDAGTIYFKGSTVAVINDTEVTYYRSLTDNNQGNSVTDGINWVIDSISKIETYNTNLTNAINTLNSQVVKLTGTQTISGTKTFNTAPKIPNSSAVGTAITTSALSNVNNGYLKMGNGVILQWGWFAADSNAYPGGRDVTLPTPFSHDTYRLVTTLWTAPNSGGIDFNDVGIVKQSTSSFKIRMESTTYMAGFAWIAIGR